ncbi:MAG: DUF4272 domain-containing protein [Erysipelotrichaceae bacterium]
MGFFNKKKKEVIEVKGTQKVLTLYSVSDAIEDITLTIENVFSLLIKTKENVSTETILLTLNDNSTVSIQLSRKQEDNNIQIDALCGFYVKNPIEDLEKKDLIMEQIMSTNLLITIKYNEDSEDVKRNKDIMEAIFNLAKELHALILYDDMSIYTSDQKLLINLHGESEVSNFVPYNGIVINDETIIQKTNDNNRKNKSIEILKENWIPFNSDYEVASDEETSLKNNEEIIKRLCALFALGVRGETYLNDKVDDPKILDEQEKKLLEHLYPKDIFTNKEIEYYNGEAENNEHIQNAWKFENCSVLMWVLNITELNDINTPCDAANISSILWNSNYETLMEKAKMRSKEEILTLYDLMSRYLWACNYASDKKQSLENVNESIVAERVYTLKWLLNVNNISDWDSITLNDN